MFKDKEVSRTRLEAPDVDWGMRLRLPLIIRGWASKTVMGQEDSNLKMVNWIPIMESDALAYPRETAEPLSAVAPK
jgi:hypothetical protein